MEKEIKKSSNEKFIIGFILFLAILITFTIGAIYFTINYLEKNKEENKKEDNSEVQVDEIKIKDEDSSFAIHSYTDTYNLNSIKITDYYDVNGKIFKDNVPVMNDEQYINYIEISGLKDTNLQKSINERLKKTAYEIKGYTNVTANFSNCLSVEFWNDNNKRDSLNINLATGEDIPFEKLFTQSTPINYILADALYERMAWEELYGANEIDIDSPIEQFDMKNADTSNYEEKGLLLVNKYNKVKENIKYSFHANQVNVYGLIDDKIIPNYDKYRDYLTINLTKYPEYVAIFKRYLTKTSIFENDNLGYKNIIILTDSGLIDKYVEGISYGKIADNIFLEEAMIKSLELSDAEENILKKHITELSNDLKTKLKTDFQNNDSGVFYQRQYYVGKAYNLDDCYYLSFNSSKAVCDYSYFESLAFKDYIELKSLPRADVGINTFIGFMYDNRFPNFKISDVDQEEFYYDKNGKLIGNSQEEARSNLQKNNNR